MFNTREIQSLNIFEIKSLPGGRFFGCEIFALAQNRNSDSETVYFGRLETQRQSQGQERILTRQGSLIFRIKKERLEFPGWLSWNGTLLRCTQKCPARLVRLPPDSIEYAWLRRLAVRRADRDEALDLIGARWRLRDVVEEILGEALELPERLTGLPDDPLPRIEVLLDALSEFEPEKLQQLIGLLQTIQPDEPAEQKAA